MRSWSLSGKIWAVLGLLSFAFVVSAAYSLNQLLTMRDSLELVTQVFVKRDQLLADILDAQRRMTVGSQAVVIQTAPEDVKRAKERYEAGRERMGSALKEFDEIASVEQKAEIKKYVEIKDEYLPRLEEVVELGLQNKTEEAAALLRAATVNIEAMSKIINQLNSSSDADVTRIAKESTAAAQHALVVSSIVSTSSILVSLLIAFFVLRATNRAISGVVASLFDSSSQVSSAAGQIASSSQELSQAATEQAASLEETAASIEEMTSMVSKNSENANSTASTSTKSQQRAIQGKAVVEKMIESMDAISSSNTTIMEKVNYSNDRIAEIVKVIEEIGSKTKVINDIVFQTKLLSFNASVEAARAGEHGKGFAVVAEEVGNLAQMSGNAAKEISTLLDGSVRKVNEIVAETRSMVEKLIVEGKETIESGAEVARQCGDVLDEIVKDVASVSNMAGEIASASVEQSRGVTEINRAMGQMDQVTQKNAATSEECASAAEELSAQSETLKRAVELLVETVEGAGADRGGQRELPSRPAMRAAPTVQPNSVKGGKVLHMKAAQPAKGASAEASGSRETMIPSHEDKRFKDI